MQEFLSQEEVKKLHKVHRTCKNKKQADRIKTILCLNDGYDYSEIASILMLDDATLRNYYRYYITEGLEALLTDDYKGGSSFLSMEQLQSLEKHLEEHTYCCAREIQKYIEDTYGIKYSGEGVQALLHRMGFVYKKPKRIPGKADKEKQEAFIKEYQALKSAKNPEDKIYFLDGCHPHHNSIPAYGWIKKGVEKQLRSNTGRDRININGAYNVEDRKVIVREDESINAESTLLLIQQIILSQLTGNIYLIADNAKYYRAKRVREFLDNHERVKIIFLPPYSPNLNVIERLWLFFKKKKLWNRHYEKFADFKQECLSFFENIRQYDDELKTLMTDNFHLINPSLAFSKT